MSKTMIKIHISRDFSYVEFEVEADIHTGEGLPDHNSLAALWDKLPGKDTPPVGSNGLRETPESYTRSRDRSERGGIKEPPATANQRRLLESLGEWRQGMTKAEASAALTKAGY